MPSYRLLVIEDEEDILELLTYNLKREGYEVQGAASGEDGLEKARRKRPDLILLDLMLPGLDGLAVCRALKSGPDTRDIPIIMVSAKGEEADVVVGLELGADDYVTKPFSPRLLLARIRAVLRRRGRPQEGVGAEIKGVISRHGLTLHPGRREAALNGQPVALTVTEFDLLYYLAGRPGWVSTRQQIIDAVRGPEYTVTDRTVDVQIAGLRRKLGAGGELIETVRGVGYRFKE
jgi:two-component system phosphate regulon response regulator PhoB